MGTNSNFRTNILRDFVTPTYPESTNGPKKEARNLPIDYHSGAILSLLPDFQSRWIVYPIIYCFPTEAVANPISARAPRVWNQ